ncbi:nucleotide kinase [Stenotrophomonas phage Sonora]|nr:nucleotide kinase [Stenotrophomonas phage Sonora]
MKIINVRGCNGSGKTTLLRCLARSPECRVVFVAMTQEENKGRAIPVTYTPDRLAIIGDYTLAAAGQTTAGLDRIQTQAAAKRVIEKVIAAGDVDAVLFEGVIVSTIFGPWLDWSRANGGMIWAFLDTPLDVCLKRIHDRNGGKPIKEELVVAKERMVGRAKAKAVEAGERVATINWQTALKDIKLIISDALDGPEFGDGPEFAGWAERASA